MARPKRTCTHPSCPRDHYSNGLCQLHYQRRRDGKPLDDPVRAPRIPRTGECHVTGCDKPIKQNGYCSTHTKRFQRWGDPAKTRFQRSPNGTRKPDRSGYLMRRDPVTGKRRAEHLIVWEAAHGKPPRGFHVHHINEIKTDNRLENLELKSIVDHVLHHHPKKYDWSREHPCCQGCGTTERAHFAKGLCERCYFRQRRTTP